MNFPYYGNKMLSEKEIALLMENNFNKDLSSPINSNPSNPRKHRASKAKKQRRKTAQASKRRNRK